MSHLNLLTQTSLFLQPDSNCVHRWTHFWAIPRDHPFSEKGYLYCEACRLMLNPPSVEEVESWTDNTIRKWNKLIREGLLFR